MKSIGDLVQELSSQLGSASEARWVLGRATGWGGAQLLSRSHMHGQVPDHVAVEVEKMVERRRSGEPLQYVLGRWAFRSLEVSVDRRVLVPRPETEQVVGYALEELRVSAAAVVPGQPVVAVDLGTGSGVIALSLAAEAEVAASSAFEVWATDYYADALDVARANLSLLAGVDPFAAARVCLSEGSWFDALPPGLAGHVQLLVSNPPYVSVSEWESLEPVVRDYEPRRALVAGETGLEVLELLVSGAPAWLVRGGVLVLELAPDQAGTIAVKAKSAGFDQVEVRPDLAGRPRALVARRSGA
ncbi:MAG: peptide chain release factor N(5)-glutamine methyltransferase [Acidimicrobiales bacterium]